MTALYIPDESRMLLAGQRLASLFTPWLAASAGGTGALVFLHGQLGAGKTTLVRGLLRAWGVTGAVRSPTYTLVEPYALDLGGRLRRVFHLDLYRLSAAEELDYLGWQEAFGEGGLLLIEWPERGAGVLPAADLRIELAMQSPGRGLRLSGRGAWERVVAEAGQVLSGP